MLNTNISIVKKVTPLWRDRDHQRTGSPSEPQFIGRQVRHRQVDGELYIKYKG